MKCALIRARTFVAAVLCAVGWACAAPVLAGDDLDVRIQVVGDEIRANVSLFVRASPQRVWEVLTDYERAPEFTPDLLVSRVISRSGATLRLLQKSRFRYGPFALPVETVRDIRLVPPVRTESQLVSGSMKKYETTTELVPEAGGTRIIVRSQAIPNSPLVAMAGESIVRRETEEAFRQLRNEILRREHVATRQ